MGNHESIRDLFVLEILNKDKTILKMSFKNLSTKKIKINHHYKINNSFTPLRISREIYIILKLI